jgi:hypothetical protein
MPIQAVIDLELAIASCSDYIITHNRADFRDAARFGIQVVSPAQFLQLM